MSPALLLLCFLCLARRCCAAHPQHKRGVGWALNATQVEALAGLDWWYNWGASVGDLEAAAAAAAVGMTFVPMQLSRWGVENITAYIEAGSTTLLGFNEPNHGKEAAMTAQEAAVRGSQASEACGSARPPLAVVWCMQQFRML
jgi:hypothetical protein